MAKVYTGRVMIPGDKLEEYFQLMKEEEEKRVPFRESLLKLNEEFAQFLSQRLSDKTVRKHTSIIDLFIEFIIRQTDVEAIEDITKGMVNTYFKNWWKRKVWDSTTSDQLRVALKKFFNFLATEKKIINEKVLKALQ